MQYFVFETFSVSWVILLSWIWINPPCRLTVVMKMHNYPFNFGNSRFKKKNRSCSTSSLVTYQEKSKVKALIKLRIFINICWEIIKISNFQALFQNSITIWALFSAMFWALFGEFSSANMPNDSDHLSRQRADGGFPWIVPSRLNMKARARVLPRTP